MLNTMLPTISSLLFLIILILVFNSKNKINNITNKIFKLYINVCLIFCFSELLFIYLMFNSSVEILLYICWRIHWFVGCFYWGLLLIYLITLIKKIKVNKIKDLFYYDIKLKILILIFSIIPFITFIIPINSIDIMIANNELIFSNETLNIFIIVYCSIVLLILYIYYIKNRKFVSKACGFTIYIIIISTILFIILQININTIPFYFLLSVVLAYILYFNYANPDIAIMNEIVSTNQNIEKMNRTKTDFLSNMGYEIKIPMDLISNLCESIQTLDDFNDEKIKKELTQIIISGNNLLEIVNNVLDISKIESGQVTILEREYNLKDMLDDISNRVISTISDKNVKYTLMFDYNISSILIGDYSKLYTAILNIAINSAKFTKVGKIILSVTSSKNNNYEKILFKISDTGNGIRNEEKDQLFLKNAKLHNEFGDEINDIGLGYVIAKDYIEQLGGKIWFESELRVGTTFYVEVVQKIKDFTPLSNTKKIMINNNELKPDYSNKTILIVDDNKPNIKVVKRLLEKYNIKVDSVLSGQECIYKIKGENKYDLIFMDQVMDGISGIETLRVLKELKSYKLPPIIALTANAMNDTKDLFLKEGFDDYLSKPITINQLDKIVNKYFKE